MAATTNSALASAPEAISPLISTTAVCGPVTAAVDTSLDNTAHSTSSTRISQAKRQNSASGGRAAR
jgi:hypothetical protein